MIKDWVNFLPSEIDSFFLSLHDLVLSFAAKEEFTWFGLSDKWEVRVELPQRNHLRMTPKQTKITLASLLKLCPDSAAFQRCKCSKQDESN